MYFGPTTLVKTDLFAQLGLSEKILQALRSEGYDAPTPIQTQAIPHVLEGKDLIACAQTGTGKTAAFALPTLQRLLDTQSSSPPSERKRFRGVLVLSPTRELAQQVWQNFESYGRRCGFRFALVTGGVGEVPQIKKLSEGVDVIVATPGRLLDLLKRGAVDLSHTKTLVLDEADRMLDMGFLPDVKRIIRSTPPSRQTLLFSATFSKEVENLAQEFLRSPTRVSVTPPSSVTETVEQFVYSVAQKNKIQLLTKLLEDKLLKRVIVFTRTKHGANKVCAVLEKVGVRCAPIHSNKSQNARQRAIAEFASGALRVLVASDIAARGLDIDGITHVVNFDLPEVPETYVHRIGRTGRAGAEGKAFSFCSLEERPRLAAIERLTKKKVQRVQEHPFQETDEGKSEFTQSKIEKLNHFKNTRNSPRVEGKSNKQNKFRHRQGRGV